MWEKGQKTKRCYFWMNKNDIDYFSEILAAKEPWLTWQSQSAPQANQQSFKTLAEALDFDANKYQKIADTQLELGGLRIMIGLREFAAGEYKDPYAPNFLYPHDGIIHENSEMNVRWNMADANKEQCELMETQVRTIFHALTKATLPAKIRATAGHPVRGFRIGARMLAQVHSNGWFLKSNGPVVQVE